MICTKKEGRQIPLGINSVMRQRRIQLGMTQNDLGKAIGETNMVVHRWETYQVKRPDSVLLKLATVLGCTTDELWPPWLEVYRLPRGRSLAVTTTEFSALRRRDRWQLKTMPTRNNGSGHWYAVSELRQTIDEMLKTLPHRSRRIVELRYGFDDGVARTLEEVGAAFKVSRERVRQIEAAAMRKLKLMNKTSPGRMS